MEYIAAKAYDGIGIDGPIHLTKGSTLIEEGGILSYNGKRVCYKTSQDARDFFARNDDGKGRNRHQLSHAILNGVAQLKKDYGDAVANALSAFERDEEGNYPAEAKAAVEAIENKPALFFEAMHADPVFDGFLTNGYWNFNFFDADIEELQRLQELL